MASNEFRPTLKIEDDERIFRKKRQGLHITMRVYKLVKLCLVIAIPVVYFLYSQLLFFVFLALALMLVLTNMKEKQFNKGLKKEMQSHLPKGDSLLAILVMIITVISIIFSVVSSTQRKSMFDGFDETEIKETVELGEFNEGEMIWRQIQNQLRTLCNLSTGERVFFQESRRFGMMGGGMPPMKGDMPSGGQMPDMGSFEPPKDMSEMLDNMPFDILFSSILKSVNAALVFLVAGVGVICLVKIRKVED